MDNQNSYEYQKNLDEYYYGNNMHMTSSMNDNVNYMLPHNGKQHAMDNPHMPPQPIPLHQPQPHPHLHQPYQPTNLPIPPPTIDHHAQPYNMQHLPAPSIPPMYHQMHPSVIPMHHQMPSYPINYPPADTSTRLPELPQTQPADLTPKNVITETTAQDINTFNTKIPSNEPTIDERTKMIPHPEPQQIVPITPSIAIEPTITQAPPEINIAPIQQPQLQPQQQPLQQQEPPNLAAISNVVEIEKPATITPVPVPITTVPAKTSMLDRVITGCPKKRRRRIVQLNDDDDESDDNANDLKRELLNKSPVLEAKPAKKENELISSEELRKPDDDDQEASEDSSEDSSDSEEEPSVITDPEAIKEHQARSLLKSAVIIQASEKKKKNRIIESDDEEQQQQITNVDDIGMLGNEQEEEPFVDTILVNETNLEPMEIDKSEKVIPIENPIIPQEDIPDEIGAMHDDKSSIKREIVENDDKTTSSPEPIRNIKKEHDDDIDPARNVEVILEKNKNSSDDDEYIPNDVYFGTPDIPNIRPTTMGHPGPAFKKKSVKRKRKEVYEKEASSDSTFSEGSSSYSEDSSSSESNEDRRPRKKPISLVKPAGSRPISINPQYSLHSFPARKTAPPPKRKVVRDRFYDRSRDIPNDVYFGDVKVPLHILHTRWGSDASDSSSSDSSEPEHVPYSKYNSMSHSFKNMRPVGKMMMKPRKPAAKPATPQMQVLDDDPKVSIFKNFIKVAGIKVNYGRLFEGIISPDDKCILLRRVLAQKGLQGEPTIAKCKQLKLDLQTKKEIADLDTSVIISEGRTRRSCGRNKSKSSSKGNDSLQPETLQTLSKIKRVIDSDSE